MVGNKSKNKTTGEIDIIGSADKNTALLVNVSGVMKVLTSVFLKHLLNTVSFLISAKSIFIFFQSPVLQRVALIRQMNSEMSA